MIFFSISLSLSIPTLLKNSIELFAIISHVVVLLQLVKIKDSNTLKSKVYFTMDTLVVLSHLLFYQNKIGINFIHEDDTSTQIFSYNFHLIMILLHQFVHFEAVLVLIYGKSIFIENLLKRAFILAEGDRYEKTFLDLWYKFLTIQDICTHLMNFCAVLSFRKLTVFDFIVIMVPYGVLHYFYSPMITMGGDDEIFTGRISISHRDDFKVVIEHDEAVEA